MNTLVGGCWIWSYQAGEDGFWMWCEVGVTEEDAEDGVGWKQVNRFNSVIIHVEKPTGNNRMKQQ